MKKLVLATLITSFIAGSALAANTANLSNSAAKYLVIGGDEVTLELTGNIEKICKMQFYDGNIRGASANATVQFKEEEQNIADVVVWCNDGSGKADITVDATNGFFKSQNVNGGGYSKIDYLFRFHENTSLGDKLFNLSKRQKLVEDIWTSTDGQAFDPEAIAKTPEVKKLYVKPINMKGWERSGDYDESITLTISPISL